MEKQRASVMVLIYENIYLTYASYVYHHIQLQMAVYIRVILKLDSLLYLNCIFYSDTIWCCSSALLLTMCNSIAAI
jgi:hypothetical protein